jgi:prepilin-type N-terminal cleavage/methylation domain-containing protein
MTVAAQKSVTEPHRGDAGFTLLELLVALALTALLMAAVPAALRIGTRAINQAEVLTNDAADRAAIDFVAERLTEAMTLYERGADGRLQVAFSGAANAIGFVTSTVMDPRGAAPAGIFLMELGLDRADGELGRLVLRWQPFRPGQAKTSDLVHQERALLANVSALSFRYFGSAVPRAAAAWSDIWTGTETVPALVEIQVRRGARLDSEPLVMRVPLRLRPSR